MRRVRGRARVVRWVERRAEMAGRWVDKAGEVRREGGGVLGLER
jgi:hypothetical protein